MSKAKYTTGQRVTCNGNPQGRIIRQYSPRMYEVRLMDGCRHIGAVCVSEADLDLENGNATALPDPDWGAFDDSILRGVR